MLGVSGDIYTYIELNRIIHVDIDVDMNMNTNTLYNMRFNIHVSYIYIYIHMCILRICNVAASCVIRRFDSGLS